MATNIDLVHQMAEVRKWLTGGYGPLPGGISLHIKPPDFDSAVLATLTEGALVARARTLLGEAHRVIRELMVGHTDEARFINGLLTHASSLSNTLQKLGGGQG